MDTISKNPIQRFKEGRKIVKAQGGLKTYRGQTVILSPSGSGNYVGYNPKTKVYDYNLQVGASELDTKIGKGNASGNIYKGYDGNWYQNGKRMTNLVGSSETVTGTNKEKSKSGGIGGGTGKGTVISVAKPSPTSFMGEGIQQGWRGTAGNISGVTEAQRQQLINSKRFTNDDFKDARTLQIALNRELSGLGKGSISVDNKWGSQSQKALQAALVGLPAISPTPLPENSVALQMTPKPITYTVNNLSGTTGNTSVLGGIYTPGVSINGTSTIQNDIQNMNLPTYNRKGVRDYLRQLGFNPYSFNGAQRRALRMILNNTGDSTDSAIVQGMGLFKQGGSINNKQSNLENMNKFQDGGAMQADPQQQIMALVQAAMQGDQEAQSTIQQIQQAAQQGDQQASQMLQMIQGVMQQMQGQAQMAKRGAKLNYINRLKGNCPEGYQMNYFKVGGKVCRQCQKMETPKASCGKKRVKKGCSGMVKGIRAEMGAKLESMKKGGSTAFGDRSHTPASTNAQGRFGGRKAFNEYGTHKHPKVTRNVFSAFGDEGKKKPTNVGLVGHHATGNTGLMRTKETAKNNKHTAFGAAVARFHKGAKPTSKGGITTIKGAPKGKSHDGGLKKVTKNAFGGSLNGVPFYQHGAKQTKTNFVPKKQLDQAGKDSVLVNKYNDQEIQATKPGKYIMKNGKLVWVPDRTQAPYNNK